MPPKKLLIWFWGRYENKCRAKNQVCIKDKVPKRLFCGTKKMLEDYRLLFASRSAFLNLWNILDFFSLTFIFILSTNYAWFCCILAWNIMLMHFNSSSNYRIIYRHSSTYAVFWDSTKPCKQKTVLLEKWFSTKTPKWDSQRASLSKVHFFSNNSTVIHKWWEE